MHPLTIELRANSLVGFLNLLNMARESCVGLGLLLAAVLKRWLSVSTLTFFKINDYHSHIVFQDRQDRQDRYRFGKALH
jgi:hypothetical protein